MPWIQDHLVAVLDLIPHRLEPEDEVPNFHRLKLRMAMIERQHFVLGLQEWIENNAHWLGVEGLSLSCGRNGANGGGALTFFETFQEDRAHLGPHKQERSDQIDRLVDLLDLHDSTLNQPLVEFTVADLNQIRWDPQRFRQVLAFKVSDTVSDAYVWLGRHSAARQAKALAAGTPPCKPPSHPPRRRL